MTKTDRQVIYEKLVEVLSSIEFLEAEASPERQQEVVAAKRQVREELQAQANGDKPKAKKSAFSTARYKTSDDGEKGSPEQWRQAAKAILNVNDENCLTTLGLAGVPASEADLKTAWRSAIRKAHPDLGGSQDEAARLNAAYELALSLFFSKPKMTKTTGRKDTGLRPQLLTPITEEEAEKYLADDLWCIQEKKDGKHGLLRVADGKLIAANKQGLEMSIPSNVEKAMLQHFDSVILDGELIGDQFFVFDILEYQGSDLRILDYESRYEVYLTNKIFPKGSLDCLILVPAYIGVEEKTAFFERIKAEKKEGVVFKKLNASFKEGRPETGGDMVKCKFWATLSAIVDERETGKSSFITYVLNEQGKRVYLGHCTALGKVMPQPGDIVELRYLYAYPGGKLIQQNLIGIRDDVTKEECTTKQLKFKAE